MKSFLNNVLLYQKIHKFLRKTYGPALICENPGCKKISTFYEWALLKNKEYDYKRENFWQLCKSCHVKYDENSKTTLRKVKYRIGSKHSEKTKQLMSEIAVSSGRKPPGLTKEQRVKVLEKLKDNPNFGFKKGNTPWNKGCHCTPKELSKLRNR